MSIFETGLPDDLILTGQHAALQAMRCEHLDDLNLAAADGELWNLKVTQVPNDQEMPAVINETLAKKASGEQFPFVVRRLADNQIVGSTRYYDIKPQYRNLAIGFTWYAQSAQRTAINTECKLLLLSHAFEELDCISVAFHIDHTNLVSQAAVKRLGAKQDGLLRNHQIMPDGRIRHTYCFSIVDSEWPEIKSQLSARLNRS